MTGWVVSPRHRYITDLIISSDSVVNGHFSNYHRFFSHAVWDIDQLWKLLAQLIVRTLVDTGATIYLAGDDTLCHKRGLTIFGAGMHHDACNSSKSKKLFHWGHDWGNLCLIIDKPWWAPTKVFALPICMRLYRNKQGLVKGKNKVKKKRNAKRTKAASKKSGAAAKAKKKAARKAQVVHKSDGSTRKTRSELMSEMLALVAAWFPDRKFVLVVDSLYSGKSVLRNLPENFDLIGPVHARAALYEPAPKRKNVGDHVARKASAKVRPPNGRTIASHGRRITLASTAYTVRCVPRREPASTIPLAMIACCGSCFPRTPLVVDRPGFFTAPM